MISASELLVRENLLNLLVAAEAGEGEGVLVGSQTGADVIGLGDEEKTLSVSENFRSGLFSSFRNNSFFMSSNDGSPLTSDNFGLYRPVASSCTPCCFAKRFLIRSSNVVPAKSFVASERDDDGAEPVPVDAPAAAVSELITFLSNGFTRSTAVAVAE